MIESFLTTEQVANILQVHPFTILKFIKSGKLKGIKLGRVYRIKESDVKAFLEVRSTRSDSGRKEINNGEINLDTNKEESLNKIPDYEITSDGGKGGEAPHYYII